MMKAERVQIFNTFLQHEGYNPRLDNDNDIVFKYEGKVYLIIFDEDDDLFFRIIFPNFWAIESQAEKALAEKAALSATANTKVAKVFPVNDNMWATIELFYAPAEDARAVFHRSMSALQAAVRKFISEM
jgi:hypothetical protein